MFNEGNQIHNFMSCSGSGTVINYGSGSGSDFLTSYGSGYGSGSTSQKVTVPTVPVPVSQHCFQYRYDLPMVSDRVVQFQLQGPIFVSSDCIGPVKVLTSTTSQLAVSLLENSFKLRHFYAVFKR
jgi:hypothetical protein